MFFKKKRLSWIRNLTSEISDSRAQRGKEREEWERLWPQVKAPRELLRGLWSLLSKRGIPIIGSISLEGVKAASLAGAMVFLKKFLEPGVDSAWTPSMYLLAVFIILNITHILAEVGKNFILAYLSTKMLYEIRSSVFERIFTFPINLLQKMESGAILTHIHRDVELVVNLVTGMLITSIGTVFSVLSVGYVIFYLNWQIGLLVFALLTLGIPLIQIARSLLNRYVKRLFSLQSRLMSLLQQSIYAIKFLKAMGLEQREIERVNNYLDENRIVNMKITTVFQAIGPPIELIYIFLIFGGVFISMQLFQGALTVSFLGPLLYAVIRISKPIQQLAKSVIGLEENILAAQRLFGTLLNHRANSSVVRRVQLTGPINRLALKGVSFYHVSGKDVLNDINITLRKNELTALMGESGVGKSTLCEVIMGLYEDYSGTILVDDQELRDIKMESYRDMLGFVPQEALLIRGTISENLLFGVPGRVSDSDLVSALKLSHCYDFVKKLEGGIEAHIDERGVNLSGGERQRLCLARALLKKPQILLIDEATASVDHYNEQLILDVLDKLKKEMIILFVSHRIAIHDFADRILLLENGKIKELEIRNR